MKKLFVFTLFLFLLTGCSEKEGAITKVTCSKMKELLTSTKAILVDVRTKEEYDEGHLNNAINKPLTKLSELEKLGKETPIIVYCKSGMRSNDAAKELLRMGFINIYDLGPMSSCAS